MVVRDETVYSKQWGLLFGLMPEHPGHPVAVGGCHPDSSRLLWNDADGSFPDLAPDMLADVCVCTVIKSLNSKGHCYCVQQMPRKRVTTKVDEFFQIGQILEECVKSNVGLPPASLAYDNHLSFALVNSALLGLVHMDDLEGKPFFSKCTLGERISMPMFPCRVLRFEGAYAIFGVNDPLHVQKASACLIGMVYDVFYWFMMFYVYCIFFVYIHIFMIFMHGFYILNEYIYIYNI